MLLALHVIALGFSDSRERKGSHSQCFMLASKHFLPGCLRAEMGFVNSRLNLLWGQMPGPLSFLPLGCRAIPQSPFAQSLCRVLQGGLWEGFSP